MVGVTLALVVAAVLTWAVVRLGPQLGYVDRPDDPELKAHTQPAVPLGGIAIFVAVHAGLALEGLFDGWLVAATSLMLVLGLVDDRIGLSPVLRLAVTLAAGVLLGLGVPDLDASIVIALLVIVAVNAVNLFDGLDGLAGTSAAVTGVAISLLASVRGADPLAGLVIAAALAGFLVFNWHPARAFLGDNGAYVVAVVLVWALAQAGPQPLELAASVGLLGVFLVDLLVTVLRRWRAGAPLFAGDRSHLYDRLHQSGMGVPAVAATSGLAQVALAAAVLLFVWLLSPPWAAMATVALGLAVVALLTFGSIVPAGDASP